MAMMFIYLKRVGSADIPLVGGRGLGKTLAHIPGFELAVISTRVNDVGVPTIPGRYPWLKIMRMPFICHYECALAWAYNRKITI